MSDKKIHVELDEDVARAYAQTTWPGSGPIADVRASIRAALPPEYPEGTVAWVTGVTGHRTIAWREDGMWMTNRDEGALATSYFPDHNVTKVEPLRVLADDELAVKRVEPEGQAPIEYTPKFIRGAASSSLLCERIVRAYADALDAEAKS